MARRKWTEVHKELTTVNVRSFFCGSGQIEVWLIVKVKQNRNGKYKGVVYAKSVTSDDVLQVYQIDYIRTKHSGSQLVTVLDKYEIIK